jgi:hypothetical protein
MLWLVIKGTFTDNFPLAYSKQIFSFNHKTQCYPKSLLILLYKNRPPPEVTIIKSTSIYTRNYVPTNEAVLLWSQLDSYKSKQRGFCPRIRGTAKCAK